MVLYNSLLLLCICLFIDIWFVFFADVGVEGEGYCEKGVREKLR